MGRREPFLQEACETLRSEGFTKLFLSPISLIGITCDYFPGDVRKYDICEGLMDFAVNRFGRIDILGFLIF